VHVQHDRNLHEQRHEQRRADRQLYRRYELYGSDGQLHAKSAVYRYGYHCRAAQVYVPHQVLTLS
jgi:hypothetical protein